MRYSVNQYATALVEALDGKSKKEQGVITRRFIEILQRNRDLRRLNLILTSAERQWLKKQNLIKAAIASASPLTGEIRDQISAVLGRRTIITQSIEPQLLAGIRILIDDEVLIDASAKRRLAHLFATAKISRSSVNPVS